MYGTAYIVLRERDLRFCDKRAIAAAVTYVMFSARTLERRLQRLLRFVEVLAPLNSAGSFVHAWRKAWVTGDTADILRPVEVLSTTKTVAAIETMMIQQQRLRTPVVYLWYSTLLFVGESNCNRSRSDSSRPWISSANVSRTSGEKGSTAC